MDYVGIISKLLICIFEAYIYYDFFKNIFEYRSSKKIVHIGLLALMAIAIWLVNCQDNSLLNVCMVPVLFFVFNCFLYKESIRNRILYVIVFFVVMMGIELIFEIIFSVACGLQHIEVMENPYNWTLIVMVEKTISLIVFRIIKYINNKIGNYIDRKLYRWVYILPITSLIIFVGFIYSDMFIVK